jgi:hypothetical protein
MLHLLSMVALDNSRLNLKLQFEDKSSILIYVRISRADYPIMLPLMQIELIQRNRKRWRTQYYAKG